MNQVDIHESAIVDSGAQIGAETKIWHFAHICSGAKIGTNCSLGQNTYVGPKAVIGNNVKIQNNVSVYDGVLIGDNVFCGPSMVFTNVYNPRSAITRKAEYRTTVVEHDVSLGANCTIVCGVTIGAFAFVGAGSVINKNVVPFALVVGVPGKQIGWMSEYGEQLSLPLIGNGEAKCKATGQLYKLINGAISRPPSAL